MSEPVGGSVCFRHPQRETWVLCQRCGRPICPDCMRPAAVGHQCPECVQRGAKATRSGKTAYGGAVSANPAATSIALIAINAAVFLLILATGGETGRIFETLALLPESTVYRYPDGTVHQLTGVAGGAVWQLFTSMFTHAQPMHIGFNMLALWFLGPSLEQVLGRVRFLAVYLLGGLAGSAVVFWLAPTHVQTIGASGAIFAMMGALVIVAMRIGANPSQILIWIGINLVLTFTIPNVSWQGHLGGLLGGIAVAAAIVFSPRGPRRATAQWLAIAAVGAVVLVLVALRLLVLIA